MNIESTLQQQIQKALQELYDITETNVQLQPTKKDFEGFYTFVTFAYTKPLRLSPTEIGQALGTYLSHHTTLVSKFNVVQGFLNISIDDNVWVTALNDIVLDADYGTAPAKGESVMVEFSSPNTNKPLHLGHLRNDFLGDSIARILEASGYSVIKACLVNDRGIHICKSMLAYAKFGEGESPTSSGMKGDHLIGKYYVMFDKIYKAEIEDLITNGMPKGEAEKKAPSMLEAQQLLLKWEQNDPDTIALWKQMNGWVYDGFAKTYQNIGVSFDKMYYESDTYLLGKTVVEEGLTNGVFYKKEDGSVWIDLTPQGLDHKLVLRADGTSVYITQDLGTTDLKFKDFDNKKSIWVVGNEQDYHFQVLFAIMKQLGRSYANDCYHLSYGMVDLPSGKMKSREGTVVDADDLISEMITTAENRTRELGKIDDFESQEATKLYETLGLGALKYFLLKVDPKKRMLFNPEESVDFQGHTGPFIQYTHARIKSVMRKAEQLGIDLSSELRPVVLTEVEQEMIYCLTQFPSIVADAARDFSPALVSQYAYELAKTYNSLWAVVSVIHEPDAALQRTRVLLSKAVGQAINKSMGLLGITVPERM
jgi:arginyl-tRNA synthetase